MTEQPVESGHLRRIDLTDEIAQPTFPPGAVVSQGVGGVVIAVPWDADAAQPDELDANADVRSVARCATEA